MLDKKKMNKIRTFWDALSDKDKITLIESVKWRCTKTGVIGSIRDAMFVTKVGVQNMPDKVTLQESVIPESGQKITDVQGAKKGDVVASSVSGMLSRSTPKSQ